MSVTTFTSVANTRMDGTKTTDLLSSLVDDHYVYAVPANSVTATKRCGGSACPWGYVGKADPHLVRTSISDRCVCMKTPFNALDNNGVNQRLPAASNTVLCPDYSTNDRTWLDDTRVRFTSYANCVRNDGSPCDGCEGDGCFDTDAGLVDSPEACLEYMDYKYPGQWDFLTYREILDANNQHNAECKSFVKKDDEVFQIPEDGYSPNVNEVTLSSSSLARQKTGPAEVNNFTTTGSAPVVQNVTGIESGDGGYGLENGYQRIQHSFGNKHVDVITTRCTYPLDAIPNYVQALELLKLPYDERKQLLLNYCFSPEEDLSVIPPGLDSAPKALSLQAIGSLDPPSKDICQEAFEGTNESRRDFDEGAKNYCQKLYRARGNDSSFDYTRTGCQCILDQVNVDTPNGGGLRVIQTTPFLSGHGAHCSWLPCLDENEDNLNTFADKALDCAETPECLNLIIAADDADLDAANFIQNANCDGSKCPPECPEGEVCDDDVGVCHPDCLVTGCESTRKCNPETGICESVPASPDGPQGPVVPQGPAENFNSTTIIIISIIVGAIVLIAIGVILLVQHKKKKKKKFNF